VDLNKFLAIGGRVPAQVEASSALIDREGLKVRGDGGAWGGDGQGRVSRGGGGRTGEEEGEEEEEGHKAKAGEEVELRASVLEEGVERGGDGPKAVFALEEEGGAIWGKDGG
jgi:hypothetical protein